MPLLVPTRVAFKNILVATDFSPASEMILPYARSFARQYDSTLFFTHAIPTAVLTAEPNAIEGLEMAAQRYRDELEARGLFKGIRHEWIIEEGEPWSILEKVARDEEIDLIIVGTHGRTGFNRLVMGSVAEDVFRHAYCPVLTIGPSVMPASADAKIYHVLFATDLHPENPGPVAHAVSIAQEHRSHLTMLFVDEVLARAATPEHLLRLIPEDMELWCEPETIIEAGDPAEKIIATAVRQHADIIVLGAHRPAIFTTHLMDVAYKVVCGAPCPVLTVGPEYHA